ncbi:hypothetical protein NDU88_006748 [Pleurodeles waltl]|uniref:Uncharacterized protein n=1 Tax=Pleurodeles waltl TaxID=8319 RepID=A0AAV7X1K0_PLEWA|nr:hypothetical protein NDU88_006748 [Pleurodeles waltl]
MHARGITLDGDTRGRYGGQRLWTGEHPEVRRPLEGCDTDSEEEFHDHAICAEKTTSLGTVMKTAIVGLLMDAAKP